MNDKEIIILGIDHGLDGAFTFIDLSGNIKYWFDMPTMPTIDSIDTKKLYEIMLPIREKYELKSCSEMCYPGEKMSKKSCLSFGRNIAGVETVLSILGISVAHVKPEIWKKQFYLINKTKSESVECAIKLNPSFSNVWVVPYGNRGRVTLKHNRAESYLIAEYYRRILNLKQ